MNANRRRKETGWSLPLIPILLAAIIGLTYFFGWKVLLIVLAVFVVIPLATFVYDRFPRRAPRTMHFWFQSDHELSRLWELLVGAEQYSDDIEDVWEWRGVEVQEGVNQYHILVSRKHGDRSYPVHITVTYQKKQVAPELREQLGRRFANALEMNVKAGPVEYLGGNRFSFTEEETFTPGA